MDRRRLAIRITGSRVDVLAALVGFDRFVIRWERATSAQEPWSGLLFDHVPALRDAAAYAGTGSLRLKYGGAVKAPVAACDRVPRACFSIRALRVRQSRAPRRGIRQSRADTAC